MKTNAKRVFRIPLILLLLVAAIALVGCVGLHGLKEDPKVSIADIRVQDVKALESIFLIQLRVLNPNDIPLTLRGVNCDLEVDGRHFASGIADSDQLVPAYGTAIVPVKVYASMLDMVSSVVDLIQSANPSAAKEKSMAYILKGTVGVETRGFDRRIPFTSKGELSLQGIGMPK